MEKIHSEHLLPVLTSFGDELGGFHVPVPHQMVALTRSTLIVEDPAIEIIKTPLLRLEVADL